MAVFSKVATTTLGLNLYAKVQAGAVLNFTRMQIGGGQLPSGNDPAAQTALITPITYFAINSISANLNTANVKGIFENTLINVDTYTCELGLFATDPDLGEILYAYANALNQGDTIPPISSGPLSKQFQINVAIGNSTSTTATIPANTFIPTSDKGIANGVATLDATIKTPLSQLSLNIPAANLANGAATDQVIGNRSINDVTTPTAGPNTPTNLFGMIGNLIKNITGQANWYTLPSMTIAAIATSLGLKAPIASPTFTGNVRSTNNVFDDSAGNTTIAGALTINGSGGSFANSNTQNGYQKLPSRLIRQWGLYVGTSGNPVNFPITFPTACVSVQLTPSSGALCKVAADAVTTFHFYIYHDNGSGTANTAIYWEVLGY